jgi:hypothetical protein
VKIHDTEAVWGQLLPLISSGLSVPAALQQLPEPRPSLWWCKMAIRKDPELAQRYRTAQEERADVLADQIVELANEPMPAGLRGADASAWVQRQRLKFDALRWTASKLRPKAWGDHLSVDVAVEARISIRMALEQAQRRLVTLDAEPTALLEHSRVEGSLGR